MLAKVAVLVHNKAAMAVLGALLVVGSGTAVALAATNGAERVHVQRGAASSHVEQGDQRGHDAEHEDENENEGELEGTVGSVGKDQFTVKLEDGSTQTVTVSDKTEFEDIQGLGDLMSGMEVEVKGSMQSDHTFAATSVEVRHDGEHENENEVEHHGGEAGDASHRANDGGNRGGSGSGSHGGGDDGSSHG